MREGQATLMLQCCVTSQKSHVSNKNMVCEHADIDYNNTDGLEFPLVPRRLSFVKVNEPPFFQFAGGTFACRERLGNDGTRVEGQ